MAFRPVGTEGDSSGDGPLRDKLVELGSDAEDTGYAEYRRLAPVAGSFGAGPRRAGRWRRAALLIGKYEVAAQQYAAVTASPGETALPEAVRRGDACPRAMWLARCRGLCPRLVALAARAGRRASRLHRARQPVCRPRRRRAGLRAPAHRGRVGVRRARRGRGQSGRFREPRFPMPDGMAHYVWFNESAEGRVRPMGVLAPNPAGSTTSSATWRRSCSSRFGCGVSIARTGEPAATWCAAAASIPSPRNPSVAAPRSPPVRQARRRRHRRYRIPGAAVDAGADGAGRLTDVRDAWSRLGTDVRATATHAPPPAPPPPPDERHPSASATRARAVTQRRAFDDPVMELSHLGPRRPDEAMNRRLERLRGVIAANAERLYEQRARSAREALRFGGLLCQKLADEGSNLALRERRLALCEEGQRGVRAALCRTGEAPRRRARSVFLQYTLLCGYNHTHGTHLSGRFGRPRGRADRPEGRDCRARSRGPGRLSGQLPCPRRGLRAHRARRAARTGWTPARRLAANCSRTRLARFRHNESSTYARSCEEAKADLIQPPNRRLPGTAAQTIGRR